MRRTLLPGRCRGDRDQFRHIRHAAGRRLRTHLFRQQMQIEIASVCFLSGLVSNAAYILRCSVGPTPPLRQGKIRRTLFFFLTTQGQYRQKSEAEIIKRTRVEATNRQNAGEADPDEHAKIQDLA